MPAKKADRPRVFSVGYSALAPADLKALVTGLRVVLIDVRSRPSARVKRGFARADLEELLGRRYEHRPGLGGFGPGPSVEELKELAADPRRMLLMCSEQAPFECHRHHAIAMPLAVAGVTVHHVFLDEVVTAVELQRAVDEEDEYAFRDLGDVLAEARRGR